MASRHHPLHPLFLLSFGKASLTQAELLSPRCVALGWALAPGEKGACR